MGTLQTKCEWFLVRGFIEDFLRIGQNLNKITYNFMKNMISTLVFMHLVGVHPWKITQNLANRCSGLRKSKKVKKSVSRYLKMWLKGVSSYLKMWLKGVSRYLKMWLKGVSKFLKIQSLPNWWASSVQVQLSRIVNDMFKNNLKVTLTKT